MRDMTEGKIVPSLFAFAMPLLISSILQQLYGTVDTIIIGRYLGENAFAAVGIASSVVNVVTFVLVGLTTGMSIIMAELYGAKDESAFRREIFTSYVFGGALTALLSIIGIALATPILRLINTPPEILEQSRTYLITILAGLIFTFLYNGFASTFRARGDSKSATMFLGISLVLHIALALLFVGAMRLGVFGAALSTVVAQGFSVALCLMYKKRIYPQLKLRKEDMRLDKQLFKKTVSYGSVVALQQSTIYIGRLLVQSAINVLGPLPIAAHTASAQIEAFLLMPGNSVAGAITTFIAQNAGARRYERISSGFRRGMTLSVCCTSLAAIAMFFLGGETVSLFIEKADASVISLGASYLKTMMLFYILSSFCDSFQGYFRGTGRITVTFFATLIQIAVRVALCYMLTPTMSLTGVAVSTGIGWVIMITYQLLMYFTRKHSNKLHNDFSNAV